MLKKQNQKGFTIIEVLIVLAIAAVILMVVFLAVPALQRNSRNSQRKADVTSYLAGVNEWINNNNGQVPASDTDVAAAGANSKLKVYEAPSAVAGLALASGGTKSAVTDVDTMTLVLKAKCNGAAAVYSARGIAVLYAVETGGGSPSSQCVEG